MGNSGRVNLKSRLITLILLFTALCPAAFGKIIYVDEDATGDNNGSSVNGGAKSRRAALLKRGTYCLLTP